MKKTEILEHLRAAKVAHINWVQRAKLLISGLDIKEESIPVNSTECRFGKWFYGDGQLLNAIRNNPTESMQNIEKLHFELHDIYLNIFKTYYSTQEQGFFSKLFGKEKKISESEHIMALQHFDRIKEISNKLIEEINVLERRISAISDAEIKELV